MIIETDGWKKYETDLRNKISDAKELFQQKKDLSEEDQLRHNAILYIEIYFNWQYHTDIISEHFNSIKRRSILYNTSVSSGLHLGHAKTASFSLANLRELYQKLSALDKNLCVPNDIAQFVANIKRTCSFDSFSKAQEDYEALFSDFISFNGNNKIQIASIALEYALILFERASYEDKYPKKKSEANKAWELIKDTKVLEDVDSLKGLKKAIDAWMLTREKLISLFKDLVSNKKVETATAQGLHNNIIELENEDVTYQYGDLNYRFNFKAYMQPDKNLWQEIEKWFAIKQGYDFENDSKQLPNDAISIEQKKTTLLKIINTLKEKAPQEPEKQPWSFAGSGQQLFSRTEEQLIYTDWVYYGIPLIYNLSVLHQNASSDPSFFEIAITTLASAIQLEPLFDSPIPFINGSLGTRGKQPYKTKLSKILHEMMISECDTLTEDNFPFEIYSETDAFRELRISNVLLQFALHIYGFNRGHDANLKSNVKEKVASCN